MIRKPRGKSAATSMSQNGEPQPDPACLYTGQVMHQRMRPFSHRFEYSVFSVVLDLDQLEEADRLSRFFSIGRFNLLSFSEKDHGPRDGSSLRVHVDRELAKQGLKRAKRVLLLAYPRVLGSVFNPLAVYYAYDDADQLMAVIYEVRNTFGGMHHYVAPVREDQLSDGGLRQSQEKLFHVSPFIDMQQTYHFSLLPPGRSVRIRILEKDADGLLLSASFAGNAQALTSLNILKLIAKIPHLTLKVLLGIHWQALKLWFKGAKFHRDPSKRKNNQSVHAHTETLAGKTKRA